MGSWFGIGASTVDKHKPPTNHVMVAIKVEAPIFDHLRDSTQYSKKYNMAVQIQSTQNEDMCHGTIYSGLIEIQSQPDWNYGTL